MGLGLIGGEAMSDKQHGVIAMSLWWAGWVLAPSFCAVLGIPQGLEQELEQALYLGTVH